MPFKIRLRFKMAAKFQNDFIDSHLICLSDSFECYLSQKGAAYPTGFWTVITAGGFDTRQNAEQVGTRLLTALNLTGSVSNFGVDVGFSALECALGPYVQDEWRKSTGKTFIGDVHGLLVIDEETENIFSFQALASRLVPLSSFESQLRKCILDFPNAFSHHIIASSLINDSHFSVQEEAKFILLISAVEALCGPPSIDDSHGLVIDKIIDSLGSFSCDQNIIEELRIRIERTKLQSIRSRYMSKFRSLLSENDAREFDDLYKRRSAFLHNGAGRGEMAQYRFRAQMLASRLLSADLAALNDTPSS